MNNLDNHGYTHTYIPSINNQFAGNICEKKKNKKQTNKQGIIYFKKKLEIISEGKIRNLEVSAQWFSEITKCFT